MHGVRPKKFLGQHFLTDQNIAKKIVGALSSKNQNNVIVEIGPGTGVLTNYLIQLKFKKLILIDIDHESITFLLKKFSSEKVSIIEGDFLKTNLNNLSKKDLYIIGNFPYNISSQIFFKILESRVNVKEVVCMVQREVAKRICADPGNRTYGILSVLIGAYYDAKILFKVSPGVFNPPPKVDSAVMKLERKQNMNLNCDENLFVRIVKQGFRNRRKTLRNALKPIFLPLDLTKEKIFDKRAEQLSVEDYIELTQRIQQWKM